MKSTTDYWEFDDGGLILRRTITDTGLGFRLMSVGTNGQWRDDHAVGWKIAGANARRLGPLDAMKLAARLGGSLRDDGGIVKMNKAGMPLGGG